MKKEKFLHKAMEDLFEFSGCKPLHLIDDEQLNLRPFTFSRFYNICIECPDLYDIFIASKVPEGTDGESVTSEIIVQIRSYMLWMYGIHESFEKSFQVVKEICLIFGLVIEEVKENRVDYCWHSNYLQNPEEFFRIDRFTKMQVSRFKLVHMEYAFNPNEEYECDYISMGNRSDKCFVRIYLKSKEVVEQGYCSMALSIAMTIMYTKNASGCRAGNILTWPESNSIQSMGAIQKTSSGVRRSYLMKRKLVRMSLIGLRIG